MKTDGHPKESGSRVPKTLLQAVDENDPARKVEHEIAKATYSPILTKLQGALGPVTFTDSPFGPIAKPTVTDAQQPDSPAQMAARGRIRRVAAFWNALTNAQQQAFVVAAKAHREMGEEGRKGFALSGYAYYSRLTNVWLNCHYDQGTPPVAPPTSAYAGESVGISASAGASHTIVFSASDTTANPQTRVELWIQPLKRASRKPSAGGYRLLTFADFSQASTVAIAVDPGAYAAGYRFVNSATGERTGFVAMPVSGVVLALEQGGADEKPAARRKAA